ncbi:MAG: hypothetical protein ACHQIL_09470 [Steroidobacterales bacterium]
MGKLTTHVLDISAGIAAAGRYMLTLHVADYFRSRGISLPDPAFIERALIPIGRADNHE